MEEAEGDAAEEEERRARGVGAGRPRRRASAVRSARVGGGGGGRETAAPRGKILAALREANRIGSRVVARPGEEEGVL